MKKLVIIIVLLTVQLGVKAQFAPQANVAGSDAISKNSGKFTGWATACVLQRGYADIADPSQGYPTIGNDQSPIGIANNDVVSLGDSGIATLTFVSPIYNGTGPDFAVFENGFPNGANLEESFMELAFVEVSSDGVNYTRFKPTSLSSETVQVPMAGVYMNARNVNNLAGKYIAGFGTSFDLAELEGTPGLDVNNITHVRIVDLIGSLNGHESYDKDGRKINDPYPTPVPGGGFDLDAVGAFYQHGLSPVSVDNIADATVSVYPNPTVDYIHISLNSSTPYTARLTDITGKVLKQEVVTGDHTIQLTGCTQGIYYLVLQDANGNKWAEKITKL